MNKKKSIVGLTKKIHGDQFESMVKFFANRDGFGFKKIPEGCKRLPGGKIIPIKSPFDFIISMSNKILFADAKSIDSGNFAYSMLDRHQLISLNDLKSKASLCGYVINLCGEVYFFEIDCLLQLQPKSSLLKENGIFLGIFKDFSFKKLDTQSI